MTDVAEASGRTGVATRADVVIVGGPVFDSSPPATAVAIADGRIAAVADERSVKQLIDRRTEVLNADGGLITAGLNDAHVHVEVGAISRQAIDLSECRTVDDVLAAVRAGLPTDPGAWVVGRGLTHRALGGVLPTRKDLDRVVGDRPAALTTFDLHSTWASSAALRAVGITSTTKDPPRGIIVREPGGSEPSGYLMESASRLVRDAIPRPSMEQLLVNARQFARGMNELGITSIQDASLGHLGQAGSLDLLRDLDERGQLTLRARVAFALPLDLPADGLSRALTELAEAARPSVASPHVEFGILKAFADGVIENWTAAMLVPYADESHKGELNWDPSVLAAAVCEADRRGWQLQIHAVGDRGVRAALDAYAALTPNGPGVELRRHRIEHIETVDPADVPRFASLGVIASMQPVHALPDDDLSAVWRRRVGPERAQRAWPWASIRQAGATLAFGSDWPVVTFNPLLTMYVATARERPGAGPQGGWIPSERLDIAEAIRAYTEGSARAARAEARRGRLEVGLDADVAVWDRDLTAVDANGLLDARPRFTLFDGQVVHDGSQ